MWVHSDRNQDAPLMELECSSYQPLEVAFISGEQVRDSNEKKLIQMIKIHTDQNVADLLTKVFDVGRFQYLIASIGMLNL
ncbi:hypothetical protein Tco_0438606 [Tanacetum coccineum]